MIRAVLALMSGLLCTLAGIRHAARLKQDASRLERWVQLLNYLALLLGEGTLSIPEALSAASDGSDPPDKLFREIAGRLASHPLLSPADAYAQLAPSWTEMAALSRMFHRLSRGSRESRVLAARQTAEEIRLLADSAAATAAKDARLWQTLGLIGGICLTILLL